MFDSAWWNRGIAEEVAMASNGKAVTGTAVMARSANEEKKKFMFRHRVDQDPPLKFFRRIMTPLKQIGNGLES